MNSYEKALTLLDELRTTRSVRRLEAEYAEPYESKGLGPYWWQRRFHDRGANTPERALISGNQVGKTRTGAAEVAIHATGLYPDWWQGKRFEAANDWICAGPTNELVRDKQQEELFGKMVEGKKEPDGTGWCPKHLMGDYSFRLCGVQNVLDLVKIRHVTGGWSQVNFKSYEQGAVKFQAVNVDGVWMDEEPEPGQGGIFSECQTRLVNKDGILMLTRTPLFGSSDIINHFIDGAKGTWYIQVGWEDAPHLSEEARERLMEAFPDHERATRISGVPMMGTGGVYPVPDDMLLCPPFQIPAHFRCICGIDFGIDHPAAAGWIAHDTDSDIAYLYDSYKAAGETSAYHAAAIKARGAWIPVAWPHDGMQRDKTGGIPLAVQYSDHGVEMLPLSARYDDDTAGSQPREPATLAVLERMKTARFKVMDLPQNHDFLREKRMLHRKDGLIVPKKDDLESAIRYAIMMLRYALTRSEATMTTAYPQTNMGSYNPLASSRR